MPATFTNIQTIRADGTAMPSELPSRDRVQRSVQRVLDETTLCAWATVSADARAHINTGYFAHADVQLFLLSHPGSRHCLNLTHNPSMAVAVFASAQNWTDPGRGIQLFGSCAPVAAADVAEAERVYGRRFPAYADWARTLLPGDPARAYRFYRFVADRAKILDEGEFGDAVWVEAEIRRA
jgi:uncharacterized protein YhbP (UPF0306 family)